MKKSKKAPPKPKKPIKLSTNQSTIGHFFQKAAGVQANCKPSYEENTSRTISTASSKIQKAIDTSITTPTKNTSPDLGIGSNSSPLIIIDNDYDDTPECSTTDDIIPETPLENMSSRYDEISTSTSINFNPTEIKNSSSPLNTSDAKTSKSVEFSSGKNTGKVGKRKSIVKLKVRKSSTAMKRNVTPTKSGVSPLTKKFHSGVKPSHLMNNESSVHRKILNNTNIDLKSDEIMNLYVNGNCSNSYSSKTVNENDQSLHNSINNDKELSRKSVETEMDRIDLTLSDSLQDISFTSKENAGNFSGIDFDLIDDQAMLDAMDVDSTDGNIASFDFNVFLVLEVNHSTQDGKGPRKTLRLLDERSNQEKYCHLLEDWETFSVIAGDTVFIKGLSDNRQKITCTLDNKTDGYITNQPHILVSSTTLSNAVTCSRRAVIAELFKGDPENEVMLIGTIVHHLFDWALLQKDISKEKLQAQLKDILSTFKYLTSMYGCGVNEEQLNEKIRPYFITLISWFQKYNRSNGKTPWKGQGGEIKMGDGYEQKKGAEKSELCIDEIVDIEENIWAPSVGLKGKIDASVDITINRINHFSKDNKNVNTANETLHVPLELKTGKMYSNLGSVDHRAQVILYTIMMSAERQKDIESGLLLYLKSGHMTSVPASAREKTALLAKRSEIVRYLDLTDQRINRLPGLLKSERTCKWCSQNKTCMLYHKAIEKGNTSSSGTIELFDELTGHLTESELDYFAKWMNLLLLESTEQARQNRQHDLWTMNGDERVSINQCMEYVNQREEDGRHIVSFQVNPKYSAKNNVSIESGFRLNDYVIVSLNNHMTYAIISGMVTMIENDMISLSSVKPFRPRPSECYRIDKINSFSGSTIPKTNLVKMFVSTSETDQKLRHLLVAFKQPRFISTSKFCRSNSRRKSYMQWDHSSIKEITSQLNSCQLKAIQRCICSKDYALILGMPGTGKTTTIASLVKILVTTGNTVLLSSYTHNAVDNICLKLVKMGVSLFRLGQSSSIHPSLLEYSSDRLGRRCKTVDELSEFYESQTVVATSCLGISHPILTQRRFDFCIIDEASQITLPVCLGPMRYADMFILVGDHYQLPPLVQSIEARDNGLEVSLFRQLSERHPQSVVDLTLQYRMNQPIMHLANELIYQHKMQCGSDEIASRQLQWKLRKEICLPSHIHNVAIGTNAVVFVNTDEIGSNETFYGSSVVNENEAELTVLITCLLLIGGVEPSTIGIISPYRQQVTAIENCLKSQRPSEKCVEISTIDKYQGRDKDVIIISFVRHNNANAVGQLLKDWRRLNVAMTRAKCKLVLIGSRSTLSASPLLNKLIDLVSEIGTIINFKTDDIATIKGLL